MRKTLFTLILLILSLATKAQENKLISELNKQKGADNQVSFIMKLPILSLEDNSTIISLKKKLKSDLNDIYSCVNSFVNSKELKLNEKEIRELKKRTKNIASEFYKSNNYTLLKTSGGIAPVYGVGIDTIANKKVAVVHLGGDCSIDEIDLKWDEITSVFNSKMEALLNE
ncbi:hypothetical protein Q4Q35_15820 [Flavivirga aquimarina]|uniref:DUF4252 domain-containing protein n=1 Tax=Flavivirga aquimarina TaxID=2027862 RepID=A0ABT8WE37_9FLAO|nr:hypothetical protein [Flavivirga aquimarina]MDO5971276.1 hypothetical protein [Flavivirga aquimarina]